MVKEVYGNGAQSFLTADVDATSTTLTTSGSSWPTGGQFTILVDTEYMLVTAVSGSTLTVVRAQEFSAATPHNKGTIAFADLTVGALSRLVRQSVNGTNISARRELNFIGSNVSITDDPTNDRANITITGGSPYTAPPTTGWTLYQGAGSSGTYTTDATGCTIIEANAAGGGNENMKALVQPIPATPFKLAGFVQTTFPPGNNATNTGLIWRESATGKYQALAFGGGSTNLQTYCWTNANTYAGINPSSVSPGPFPVYLQLGYDGTSLTFAYSADGLFYTTFYTQAKNYFFATAPDQVGFYINAQNNTGSGAARLVHWKQT